MPDLITAEANRCLNCKKPRCMEGCPVHTPIPKVISLMKSGEVRKAGKILFANNPLSLVCAYVCPHENQCEGHCVLGIKGEPVHFSKIERYISNLYLDALVPPPRIIDPCRRVAIIGTGPAGITIAVILAKRGYNITMFESHDKIGGVLQYGIPGFRLPKDILERLYTKLIHMGIKIRPNILVGTTITIDDLFNDGYKAVFIGTGVWRPRSLGIKGQTLGNVHFAIDYLKDPSSFRLGKKLCIIGAGNVAIDAARSAIRQNIWDVTILYRGSPDDMSALPSEVELAKIDGVQFEFQKEPYEITEHSVKYRKTTWNEEAESWDDIPGTEGEFLCDNVIIAIGQGPRHLIVNSTRGIDVNNRGLVETHEDGSTTRPGVFSSGDVVTGAKTVVQAVRQSKMVADAIDEYVTNYVAGERDRKGEIDPLEGVEQPQDPE